MRLSASKTFKFGPLNITVSKTGLSFSLGVPGARASLNSKGEAGIRVGKKGFAYTKKKKVLPSVMNAVSGDS
jgi:hypothetical protein